MSFDDREFTRWIHQAENTLQSAVKDQKEGDHNWSCFKAQQAPQHAVKGLLYGIGMSAVGHSILKLLEELGDRGIILPEEITRTAQTLDRHYIPTTYANAHVEGAPYEFCQLPTAEAVGLKWWYRRKS